MAACGNCGLDIRWAELAETGERIKLENLPAYAGEDRFREIGYNPLTVEPVGPSDPVVGYVKHDCSQR